MDKQEAYALGYRNGSDSDMPDTSPLGLIQGDSREAYFDGYIAGVQKRDERLARGEGHVSRPEWMTDAQYDAVNKLYSRSADGSADRCEFFKRIQDCGIGSDRYAGINWCGMFVGIEQDGYTHT